MRRAVVLLIAGIAVGCAVVGAAPTSFASPATSSQALRTCVDRWNEGNMLGWGPALVNVSVRRLNAAQLAEVGLRNPTVPRCVVALAIEFRRDPKAGCFGASVVAGRPGWCVNRSATWNCVIDGFGAYECPTNADTAQTPLRGKNATTDSRGVLRLDVPLAGTHSTPPLAWQRLYPHTDGWIEPWTRSGTLRRGLRLLGNRSAGDYDGGGSCGYPSEVTHAKPSFRCVWHFAGIDPCFPRTTDWNHPGTIVACAGQAGDTRFHRFLITRRYQRPAPGGYDFTPRVGA